MVVRFITDPMGESFLALAEDMFGRDGLYILDEPDAKYPENNEDKR